MWDGRATGVEWSDLTRISPAEGCRDTGSLLENAATRRVMDRDVVALGDKASMNQRWGNAVSATPSLRRNGDNTV